MRLIEPNVFLAPFLEVIRSEETTGQITSLALSALNKFLSYGLIGKPQFQLLTVFSGITFSVFWNFNGLLCLLLLFQLRTDPTHSAIAATVDSIADAVTHARFVGSDQASDGVVLMKIVQVLRTLMLSPEGSALTNESVCEVMLSCFRICFEPRLNELLRRAAEHALKDIILLLFMRLPQFTEERHASGLIKKLKMMANGGGGLETSNSGKRRRVSKNSSKHSVQSGSIKTTTTATKDQNFSTPAIRCTDQNNEDGGDGGGGGDDGDAEKLRNSIAEQTATPNQALLNVQKSILATTPSTPVVGNIVDMQGKFMQTPNVPGHGHHHDDGSVAAGETKSDSANVSGSIDENDADVEDDVADEHKNSAKDSSNATATTDKSSLSSMNDGPAAAATTKDDEHASTNQNANPIAKGEDFVNSMGVRFTPHTENGAFRSTLHKNFYVLLLLLFCFPINCTCLDVFWSFVFFFLSQTVNNVDQSVLDG